MAPNSTTGAILQGLNLVHSPHSNPQASSDAQDLLSSAAYADLSQLDLWTNVAFASDEPYNPPSSDLNSDDGEEKDSKSGDSAATALSLKKKRDFLAKNPPNVLRQLLPPSNALGGNSTEDSQQQHASGSNPAPAVPATASTSLFPSTTPAAYDFGSLLAMSGHQISPDVMNLNQLLFANPFGQAHSFHQFAPFQQQALAPLAPVPPAPATTSTPTAPTPQSPQESTNPPPAKKPRSRKASTAVAGSQAQSSTIAAPEQRPNPVSRSPSVSDPHDEASPIDETSADAYSSGKPMTPAEDKRRRNTAASARFRAKKKEREHAMESRCKDLESKVGDLERECEALRRENGWLKGLVVGVTGGTGMPIAMPGGPGLPTIPPPQQAASTSSATTGSKRKRDSTSEATS
ncbi:hypothetical protein FRC00_013670 [Tulasnella sp. 408]|nr:hypothetical protein FRC00_013670 [Tulasnella sp. 408]